MEIKVGHTYRAKRPRESEGLVADRTVLWMDSFGTTVQYDGPSVKRGRQYPRVTREQFEAWADRDVTDELPKGEYAAWPPAKPPAA